MAVFLINGCKFKGCTLVFETLAELIQHIEEAHIELDPKVIEQQENEHPEAVALSNILRFYAGAKPKKSLLAVQAKKSRARNNSVMSSSASIRSLTPTSSEYDFDEDLGEAYHGLGTDLEMRGTFTAEQQWTNQLMLSMISNKIDDSEKPYVCKVKGCRKRYKNINGVKYHARHGHKREARMAKFTSKCFCGKAFSNVRQLELHTKTEHSLADIGSGGSLLQDLQSLTMPTSHTASSLGIKEEPKYTQSINSGLNSISVSTPSTDSSKSALSIIHPITISGSVLLTPSSSQNLKSVKKGEVLLTSKLPASLASSVSNRSTIMSSLVTSSSLVTPPSTPNKRMNLTACKTEQDEKQQAINEKVARALAAAKRAMEAAAVSKEGSAAVGPGTPRATIVTRQ